MNMKKLMGTLAFILFLSGLTAASDFMIEFNTHYFNPSDKDFRDIYGGGLMYGGEASIGVWKGLGIWFGGSYFSKKGELTFTKERTELQITPVGGGLKYRFGKGIVSFYVGAGLHSYQYKESNPIGDVSKGGLGYVGRLGSYIKVTGGLLIDLSLTYSICNIEPADFEINIGGMGAGVGIAYEF